MAIDDQGYLENKLPINHMVQNELDRLEVLIKESKKTWIVSEWKYKFDGNYKTFHETPLSKIAIQLYCIETGETKDI